ncbi:hypothetical protein ICG_03094 [Bacillus cereus BAG1X1-3]|nr:hypothetical protein ICG_03094 [Bacillus cereus BAG1X1-3]EOO77293.1 hypothetical protein IC7_01802 [Bacillus cereus BAG1O-1]
MKNETLHKQEDIIKMLDSFLRPAEPFWNEFYANREKDVPFFANVPDENLVSYIQKESVSKGKVLELGCGPGRNAIYPALTGSKTPTLKFGWSNEVRWEINCP